MPNNYIRTTDRQSWSEADMRKAIEAVVGKKMGTPLAAQTYRVPQTTIERRVAKVRDGICIEEASAKGLSQHKLVFNKDQENELVNYILEMESRLFGLTLNECRNLAFELAKINNIPNNFNKEKKMEGKSWLYGFLKRHPIIKLRSPEPTSLARAIGFNRTAVNQFFTLLSDLYDKHKFTADRIYNLDETGITTVPKKLSKVLGLRGKRQVGSLISAERGTLVTVEICMSAAGAYMPPMFIFPRKRAKLELLDDAPPGSSAEFHSSGWIQTDLFINWFRRFVEFAKPTAEKPVLLLLDGHATHSKSIELINLARKNNVVLLCFPPHCTHRLQPLDVSFMAPVSQYYSIQAKAWVTSHAGRPITINNIGKLFGAAFMKAACYETAVNGFRKTGIYPFDPNVFSDWMFKPSETTERPLLENMSALANGTANTTGDSIFDGAANSNGNNVVTEPSGILSCAVPSTSAFVVPPEAVCAMPQAKRTETTKPGRRRGKTAVLTSSPYKAELESRIKPTPKKSTKRRTNATEDNGPKKKKANKGSKKKCI